MDKRIPQLIFCLIFILNLMTFPGLQINAPLFMIAENQSELKEAKEGNVDKSQRYLQPICLVNISFFLCVLGLLPRLIATPDTNFLSNSLIVADRQFNHSPPIVF